MHALLLAILLYRDGARSYVRPVRPSPAPTFRSHGAKTYAKVTDNSGNVAFTAEGGSYHLDATARGYAGVSIDLELKDTAAVDVTLRTTRCADAAHDRHGHG